MKHPVLVILLGLSAGIAAHFAYFQYREPVATDTLEGQLAWIQTELRLTDAQYARVKEVHQMSKPRLQAMAAQVYLMQSEFAEFEHSRRTNGRVDFLEFARFVENRRAINQRCVDSTRELVLAAAEVMTPGQRRQYMDLVASLGPMQGLPK